MSRGNAMPTCDGSPGKSGVIDLPIADTGSRLLRNCLGCSVCRKPCEICGGGGIIGEKATLSARMTHEGLSCPSCTSWPANREMGYCPKCTAPEKHHDEHEGFYDCMVYWRHRAEGG